MTFVERRTVGSAYSRLMFEFKRGYNEGAL